MKGKMPAKLFRVDRWQRKTKIVVSIVLLVLIVVGILSTMMPTREEIGSHAAAPDGGCAEHPQAPDHLL